MPRPKKNAAPKKTLNKSPERKISFKASRLLGMKDLFGSEGKCFSLVYEKAQELAKVYGFSPIKTPILESFELYKKSTRKNNDKEFYFIEGDKTNRTVLRPEITQGIVRSYVETRSEDALKTVHLYSIGSVFRQEKLQTGRYRESTQFNLEIIGEQKAMTETLLMTVAHNFFKELGINVQVQINSLGDADCRKEYCSKLLNFYKERGRRSRLCTECKKNLLKNCLSLLDCKEEVCVKEREEAPQIADYLSDASREHFTRVLEYLDELDINYNFSPYLVRGLNYYNDTVFEIWPLNEDGSVVGKLALGGGGRYDSLVEKLGGPSVPGVGLALGLERTVARLRNKHLLDKNQDEVIYIAQLGEQAKIKALKLFETLREAGFNVRQSFSTDSLKAQLEEAAELNAKTSLILGKKEIMDGTIIMRDMESSAQEVVVFKKIKDRLERMENKTNNRKRGVLHG